VPTMRLELIRPKSLPPQDSVYTNFTTSALPQTADELIEEFCTSRPRLHSKLPGNILRLRIGVRRASTLVHSAYRRSWNRLGFYRILHHTASRFWLA
jgi:hypothetical protein